jgi:hypothetical protein
MTTEQMQAEIARLQAENARLATSQVKSLSLKVSEKGAVSVYGLGRFPMTAYGEQWLRLLDFGPQIQAFIKAHKAELSVKAPKAVTEEDAKKAVNF